MNTEQVEALADAALMEGIIEVECTECGISMQCEPDASTAWCDYCEKIVKVRNLLHVLGIV
jgi:hypothetical protein